MPRWGAFQPQRTARDGGTHPRRGIGPLRLRHRTTPQASPHTRRQGGFVPPFQTCHVKTVSKPPQRVDPAAKRAAPRTFHPSGRLRHKTTNERDAPTGEQMGPILSPKRAQDTDPYVERGGHALVRRGGGAGAPRCACCGKVIAVMRLRIGVRGKNQRGESKALGGVSYEILPIAD